MKPYIIVHLKAGSTVAPSYLPILGVGNFDNTGAEACDVVVADAAALTQIIANIERTPIAAMTLVQVLRAGAGLPVQDALVVESLGYAALQGGAENLAWLAARSAVAGPPEDAGPAVVLDRTGDVLSIRLNRPAAFNALNMAMRDGFAEGFGLAALDEGIREVRLSGAGRCFSVGGALEEFATAPDQATAHAVRCEVGPAFMLAPVAARTVAYVHGACIGAGAELAGLCGRVVARPGSFFQLPELRMGLIPGCGGTVGICRRVGRQRTAWMALSGRRVGVRQALAWGLVDEISSDGG